MLNFGAYAADAQQIKGCHRLAAPRLPRPLHQHARSPVSPGSPPALAPPPVTLDCHSQAGPRLQPAGNTGQIDVLLPTILHHELEAGQSPDWNHNLNRGLQNTTKEKIHVKSSVDLGW